MYKQLINCLLIVEAAMYTTSNIYPVSDFNRKSAEHIKRIQETKAPEVLTVNGKAAVVLLDPESYDQLAQGAELLRTLDNIRLAKAEHDAGKSKPIEQVFSELSAELKARYPNDL